MSTILGYFNWWGVRMQLSKRFSIIWIAVVLVFSEIGGSAQSVASGTIEGTVVDSTGGVLVCANGAITKPPTGVSQKAVTNPLGAVSFSHISVHPPHIH